MTAILEIAASNVILSALLAVVAIAATRVWRSPQLAHGLWLLVLLKLITPPLVSVSPPASWPIDRTATNQTSLPPRSGENNTIATNNLDDEGPPLAHPDLSIQAAADSSSAALRQAPAAISLDESPLSIGQSTMINPSAATSAGRKIPFVDWPDAVAIVWLAGAMAYVTILARRCRRFRRVLSASIASDDNIAACTRRLSAKLGLKRRPPVRMVAATVPPLVWSLGLRPVIVLPSKLLTELSPPQCDALICHELAHVRRRDDLIRWLEVIALVLYWWNPVAWFARRKLREAEEECCDAWVVWALPAERRSYGEAMLATIEFLSGGPKLPALAGSTFGGSFCKRRIEMIMKRNVNRKISWAALGMIVLVAVGVLPLVAQTTSTDGGESSALLDARAASADAGKSEAQPEKDVGAEADAAAVEPTGDPAVKAPSSDAVEKSSDQNKKGPRTDATGESGQQSTSIEAVMKRLSQLEQLLQERSDRHGAATTILRSRTPRVSDLTISSDKREQDLQKQLLELDVIAAEAEIEPARIKWQRSMEANKKQPGTMSELFVEQQRAELVTKEVQLQRAKTLLELHKRQVERKREEAARQQEPNSSAATTRNRQLADARQRAMRADELAQLKKLNDQIGKEITRLERLLKEEPDSPETWRAVDDFWRDYRSWQGREANKDAGNRSVTEGRN
jgi:beta-lactamase regulating signal transducer with metallopeptidase domain